jgi:hypothetical protein
LYSKQNKGGIYLKKNVFIVDGYGKGITPIKTKYIESAVDRIASFIIKGEHCTVILTGGDTENGIWKTEAEMMKVIVNRIIANKGLPKNLISIMTEEYAYNTLTNIHLSRQKLGVGIYDFDRIIIVCNEAHIIKICLLALRYLAAKWHLKR